MFFCKEFEVDIPGLAQYQQGADNADPKMERGSGPICHLLRREGADVWVQLKLTYTDGLELPALFVC
jgi:hypothetical protein